MNRSIIIAGLLLVFSSLAAAQQPVIVASSTAKQYTLADISPEAQRAYRDRQKIIADNREQYFTWWLSDKLLEAEAAAKGTTADVVSASIISSVKAPTEQEISAFYDANRAAVAQFSREEARQRIAEHLLQERQRAERTRQLDILAKKHARTLKKDINSPDLKPSDVVATIDGKPLTDADYENKFKLALNTDELNLYDAIAAAVDDAVLNDLIRVEALSQGSDASEFIAREITNKLRDYTDEERSGLVSALRARLFEKNKVKILLESPRALVQNISVDDDPALGPAGAPVTVVMFSDFQCPACAATHPIVREVIARYPGKVRFVERDFPLVTIHENAFNAALAASAAREQGKFFEYIDILYTHQDALDRRSLAKYAADLGLNVKKFELDSSLARTAAEVRKDIEDGKAYGVTSTPTIFVNGIAVRTLSARAISDAIEAALNK
jgi:protein-disulfide isomerase